MFPGHGGTGHADAEAVSGGDAPVLDVSASLSPLGPPAEALRAYHDAADRLDRYPPIDAAPLSAAYAARHDLAADAVLAGAGSTEFVYLAVRALRPARVLAFVPTYSDYQDAARVAGVPFAPLAATAEGGFARNLGLVAERARPGDMLVLCNPNNPTGAYIAVSTLLGFVRAHPDLLVLVDEAYADFLGPDASVLKEFAGGTLPANLVVLQSPTKFYAVPGLRLGYCLAHPDRIAALRDAKEPWTVSAPALAVGRVLLDCPDYDRSVREAVAEGREQLSRLLARNTPLEPLPSSANFLLVRLPAAGPDAAALRAGCLRRGVAIRDCTNFAGLGPRYVRLAVRTEAENERVVEALAAAWADAEAH